MIYHIPVLLALGSVFVKKGQSTDDFAWKPTKQDVMKLREEMAQYQPQVINGRKQYPIELVLRDRGAISFGEYGERMISSPEIYNKTEDTYGLHQWLLEKDQDALFQAYPEEREAWEDKIKAMFKGFRELKVAKAA